MTETALVLAAVAVLAVGAWLTRSWLPFPSAASRPVFVDGPFFIERRTGAVHIKDSAHVLRPGTPKPEFLQSGLYPKTKKSYPYASQKGPGQTFLLTWDDAKFPNIYMWLNFENEHLASVDFGWGAKVPTAEWTNQRIESEVSRYRDFMIRQVGSIGTFPWGVVYAARDDKAGAPTMGIRYR